METIDIKKTFLKLGTCSRTFCHVLNREFGCSSDPEERAADPLAGGIMLQGQQCGMLWGASLAAGAEAFRRYDDRGRAMAAAVSAAGALAESYAKRTGSVNCRDVTGYDMTRKLDMIRFMVKFILHLDRRCLDLAAQWAPEAVQAAGEGLSRGGDGAPAMSLNCASEVVKRLGGGEKEMVMAAGLAGGMGLGGHGCGALGAAVWMKSLAWSREHPGKSPYNNPYAKNVLKVFLETNGPELRCREITGRRFATVQEHGEFVKNGGCGKLMDALGAC